MVKRVEVRQHSTNNTSFSWIMRKSTKNYPASRDYFRSFYNSNKTCINHGISDKSDIRHGPINKALNHMDSLKCYTYLGYSHSFLNILFAT